MTKINLLTLIQKILLNKSKSSQATDDHFLKCALVHDESPVYGDPNKEMMRIIKVDFFKLSSRLPTRSLFFLSLSTADLRLRGICNINLSVCLLATENSHKTGQGQNKNDQSQLNLVGNCLQIASCVRFKGRVLKIQF